MSRDRMFLGLGADPVPCRHLFPISKWETVRGDPLSHARQGDRLGNEAAQNVKTTAFRAN